MSKKNKNKNASPSRGSDLKKKKRNEKIILAVLIPFLLVILAIVSYATKLWVDTKNVIDNSYEEVRKGKSDLRSDDVDPLKDPISVLIMGVDDDSERDLGSARTDALVLMTINPKTHEVSMVSIPRDTYTDILEEDGTSYGTTKINAAYSYGEESATIKTVENLMNVPVDYYVTFNFESFLEIVDALGGIEMEVPVSFTDTNTYGNGEVTLEEGYQTLNGEQALALSRTRKIDNDIMRGQRQQLVIEAIANKAMQVGSITKYTNVIKAIEGNMKTDLTFDQILGIAQSALDGGYTFNSYIFDWTSFTADGASMVELYEDSIDFISHRLLVALGEAKPDERDAADYVFVSNMISKYTGDTNGYVDPEEYIAPNNYNETSSTTEYYYTEPETYSAPETYVPPAVEETVPESSAPVETTPEPTTPTTPDAGTGSTETGTNPTEDANTSSE